MNRHLRLDTIEVNHLDELRDNRNDTAVRSWCRQVGLISGHDQSKWHLRINEDPTIKMFRLYCPVECKTVGACGLTSIDYINSRAEFSLYTFPSFRKSGYAKKGLTLLFEFGFEELNLNLIWGETFENNPAQYIFEKIGMTKEGIRRDFYYKNGKYINAILYSIKKAEFNTAASMIS